MVVHSYSTIWGGCLSQSLCNATYYSVIITYRNNNKVINEPGAQCIHHFLALFKMDDAKLIANLASSLLENKAGFEIGNYK